MSKLPEREMAASGRAGLDNARLVVAFAWRGPAETVNIFRGSGRSFPHERRRVSVAVWQRGSPQGSPTPSLEGALGGGSEF